MEKDESTFVEYFLDISSLTTKLVEKDREVNLVALVGVAENELQTLTERLSEKHLQIKSSDEKIKRFFIAFLNYSAAFPMKEMNCRGFLRSAIRFRNTFEKYNGHMKSMTLQKIFERIRDYLEDLQVKTSKRRQERSSPEVVECQPETIEVDPQKKTMSE